MGCDRKPCGNQQGDNKIHAHGHLPSCGTTGYGTGGHHRGIRRHRTVGYQCQGREGRKRVRANWDRRPRSCHIPFRVTADYSVEHLGNHPPVGNTLRQRYDEVGLPCGSTMGSPCPTSMHAISLPRTRRRCFYKETPQRSWFDSNTAETMFASPVEAGYHRRAHVPTTIV